MPGLVDCHVHPSYGDVLSFEELDLYTSVEFRTLRGALACRQVLRAGVTSICAPGGTWNINVGLRDGINCGMIEGPRIVAGGRYITTYNAIGSPWPTWMEHPPSSFAVLCNTRDEHVRVRTGFPQTPGRCQPDISDKPSYQLCNYFSSRISV